MRHIRFVIVAGRDNPTKMNWQRFAAGVLLALTLLFVVSGVTFAMVMQSGEHAETSVDGDSSPTTVPITDTTSSFSPVPTSNTNTNELSTAAVLPAVLVDSSEETETPLPATTVPPAPQDQDTSASQTEQHSSPTSNATPAPVVSATDTVAASPTPLPPTDTPSAVPTVAAKPTKQAPTTSAPTATATDIPDRKPTDTPEPTATATDTPQPAATNTPQPEPAAEEDTPVPTRIPDPPGVTTFGVEVNKGYVRSSIDKLAQTGASWVRYNGILWHEVEAVEGTPDWSKLEEVEQELLVLNENGLIPMVIIRGTPAWAQQVSSSCGPIQEDKLDEFAVFVRKVVARYSVAPYNVKYWEIGNEPDVDYTLVSDTMPYGCWGNSSDEYYGGQYFAEMLKVVYPAIKEEDPAATVVLGGLLLDCDPDNPPEGKDCGPSRFLEGILQNGGGNFFDVLAYHGYAFWTGLYDWDVEQDAWKQRGGALLGKAEFLDQVLQQYQLSKPILSNEIGLLCWNSDPVCMEGSYLQDQQNYLVRTYIRSWANGLLGASWYTFNYSGWNEAGLLNQDKTPRPAYYTFQFLSTILQDADFLEILPLADDTQEGYRFQQGSVEYFFYWSNTYDGTFTVDVPANAVAAYAFGTGNDDNGQGYQSVIIEGETQVQVGFQPIMFEVQP